ncbi:MAG: hypothetical protein LAT76_08085 [Schleiferiaceae bacterium]|nr:hypothetical protein [Schleiferiaceae bacterium]
MNVSAFVARRYFFSKKNTSAVNLITGVSLLGVAAGTAAMLIVLSAFNGLETLIQSLYNQFDPDLKITAARGKHLDYTPEQLGAINALSFVTGLSLTLEERALLRYRDKEHITTLKGVDDNFENITNIDETFIRGGYFNAPGQAIFGAGVAYHLGIYDLQFPDPVSVFSPKFGNINLRRPEEAFRQSAVTPTGVFSVQPEYDVKYALVPLSFLQDILDLPHHVSSIEIQLLPGYSMKRAQRELSKLLSANQKLQNREEQQEMLFRVMKSEGLATFTILAFLLVIASFSLFGSLTMLILDKRRDLFVLWSLGAPKHLLKATFMKVGLMVSVAGCLLGLVFGVAIVLVQQQFGLVSLGQGYVVESYPVELRVGDFLKIAATVLGVGITLSYFASRRVANHFRFTQTLHPKGN